MGVSWNRGYDVVLAFRSEAVNRLLAALHQSGSFYHSAWLNLPFTDAAPGSVPDGVVGLQLSPPRIAPAGPDEIDRLELGFTTRCRFQPRLGSAPAPILAHGDLAVGARLGVDVGGGEALLSVDLGSPEVTVEFSPAAGSPGLTSEESQGLEGAVRDLVANRFGSVNHRMLLPGFAGLSVRSLDARTFTARGLTRESVRYEEPEAVGLLIDFREHQPEADELKTVSNPLRHAESETMRDFAVSIHHGFLEETVTELGAPLLEDLAFKFTVDLLVVELEWNGKATPSSLNLNLRDDGTIRLEADGVIRGPTDYDLSLRQDLSVSVQNGAVVIARAGDPSVKVDGWVYAESVSAVARDKARPILDDLAAQASAAVNAVLHSLRSMLLDSLGVSGAGLTLSRVHVDAGALRLLADFDPPALAAPVADWSFRQLVEEIGGAPKKVIELNALHSWAPGGEIRSFRWKWRRLPAGVHDPDAPPEESGETKVHGDFVHRLVEGEFDPDTPRWLDTEITLEVEARQPDSSSSDGYRTVYASHSGWIRKWDPESWSKWYLDWENWSLEIDIFSDKGEIRGRTSVPRAGRKGGPAYGSPTLVGYDPDKATLEQIRRALDREGAIGELGGELITLVILSEGRRDLTELQQSETRFGFAIDHDGAWAEALGAGDGQVTVLFDGAGKELWRQEGAIGTTVLRSAFREHLPGVAATGTWKRVELSVACGEVAPDFPIDHLGHRVGLRKFDQSGVALCFIKSRSDACLGELQRLSEARGEGELLLAICDGEDGAGAAAAIDRLGLDVQVVPDADRAIAGRYGVSIWPTVVYVARGGTIAHIQMGTLDRSLLVPRPTAAAPGG